MRKNVVDVSNNMVVILGSFKPSLCYGTLRRAKLLVDLVLGRWPTRVIEMTLLMFLE